MPEQVVGEVCGRYRASMICLCLCHTVVCVFPFHRAHTKAHYTRTRTQVTNPLQNIWYICKDVPSLSHIYSALSPVFTYLFVGVRMIITPLWSVSD